MTGRIEGHEEPDGGAPLVVGERDATAQPAAVLRRPPTDEERSVWLAMTPAQRKRAVRRASLLDRWAQIGTVGNGVSTLHGEGSSDVKSTAARVLVDLATQAGVKPKYFRAMASAWRRDRSLGVLGAFATAPRERRSRLDPFAMGLLAKAVAEVVPGAREESVESLRTKVIAHATEAIPRGVQATMPSKMIVRRVIERELERLAAEERTGFDVRWDCCVTGLRRPDGGPHAVFAVIDGATGTVFGCAPGVLEHDGRGYAAAAAAARSTLSELPVAASWAQATRRMEIVPYAKGSVDPLVAAWLESSGVPDVNLTAPRAHGRYLRRAVGGWLGRAQLFAGEPGRSVEPVDPPWSEEEFSMEIARAVARHNARLSYGGGGADAPPLNLLAALGIASGHAPAVRLNQ